MAAEALGALVVLVGLVFSAVLARAWYLPARNVDERGLPVELRGAPVLYAEETFRSKRHQLIARLDRAYDLRGEVVLVEFKTRNGDRVLLSDVIELSVQRVALQDDSGIAVSMTAWVVVEDRSSGARVGRRVTLFDQAEVVRLRQRYLDVQAGRVAQAEFASSKGQCRSCGHRESCRFSRASSDGARSGESR